MYAVMRYNCLELPKISTEVTHQNCMLDECSKPPESRGCTHQTNTPTSV